MDYCSHCLKWMIFFFCLTFLRHGTSFSSFPPGPTILQYIRNSHFSLQHNVHTMYAYVDMEVKKLRHVGRQSLEMRETLGT